jgi:hypothetical protein
MHVQMGNRLPGRSAIVDADVVARRMELGLQARCGLVQEAQHCASFFRCDLEKRCHVALWND